jgi:hypothetical protein
MRSSLCANYPHDANLSWAFTRGRQDSSRVRSLKQDLSTKLYPGASSSALKDTTLTWCAPGKLR